MRLWRRIESLLSLARRKKPDGDRKALAEAASIAFGGYHGQLVLAWLVEKVFCEISHAPGLTARDTAYHEGQRSLVKMLLDLIDEHQNPPDEMKVETEEKIGTDGDRE